MRESLRAKADRISDAPRYIGLSEFASITGADARSLSRWLHNGSVWVPRPAVVLGKRDISGWEREAAEKWEPGLPGVDRPEPAKFLNAAQMQEKWGVTRDLLWKAIVEDHTISMPAMWLDGRPGWPA
ncbi:hypothetical protein [Nocardia paucivorans]|uniref:hypothetical protein n=1 Tax=Nocardia paucivorans TaxID=114259 RepID=UPI00031CECE0|nr:hypothetical protein [Nocardia paucivorans]